MGDLNQTPNSNRLHIGLFGRRNSGKSSLLNALTNQTAALVSETPGTTTDPVYKAIEIPGVGACVLIDTAGFDDNDSSLGALRVEQTEQALKKCDVALLLFSQEDVSLEKEWLEKLDMQKTPVITIISQSDIKSKEMLLTLGAKIRKEIKRQPIIVSAKSRDGIDKIIIKLNELSSDCKEEISLTRRLVKSGEVVLLVMPQDSEAPKGRLILPQVQTIRDLLDNECVIQCCTENTYQKALSTLSFPPDLIITDSKVFPFVYEKKPKASRLTSFSVLMAAAKGDLNEYVKGAQAIDSLNENSHVLIAEACTHAPLSEDIGRVKIPAMLKRKFGEGIDIEIVSGSNFPKNLTKYSLIIHCGGCMFNRKLLMSRIDSAKSSDIPITNYGIFLAQFSGILDKIIY